MQVHLLLNLVHNDTSMLAVQPNINLNDSAQGNSIIVRAFINKAINNNLHIISKLYQLE